MAAQTASHVLSLFCGLFVFVSAEQKNITAESGQSVTLPCRAPNNNILVTEWSRADLGEKYVLLYRDEQPLPDNQHPSFKNRVDLQDRQMKDGNVSVILKNVTINDAGTYECRVQPRRNRLKRALLKTYPISIIYLSVAHPGQTRGLREDEEEEEDGGKEDGVSRHYGLAAFGSFLLLLVAVFGTFTVITKKNSSQNLPADEPAVLQPECN